MNKDHGHVVSYMHQRSAKLLGGTSIYKYPFQTVAPPAYSMPSSSDFGYDDDSRKMKGDLGGEHSEDFVSSGSESKLRENMELIDTLISQAEVARSNLFADTPFYTRWSLCPSPYPEIRISSLSKVYSVEKHFEEEPKPTTSPTREEYTSQTESYSPNRNYENTYKRGRRGRQGNRGRRNNSQWTYRSYK